MASFRPEKETCPVCGRTGDCTSFASYDRYIVDFIGGKPSEAVVTVHRVKCSCGCSHAILPDPVIPYKTYSLFFILRVLFVYFRHMLSVPKICERFCISPSTLYRWLTLFREHRQLWLGVLNSLEQSCLDFLKSLVFTSPYSDFSRSFFLKTRLSFLQSHRDPTHSRRNALFRDPS